MSVKMNRSKWWGKGRMDIMKFKKESEKVCHYCGKKIMDKEDVTVDHVIPVSKGGEDGKDNFVIACRACNREKSSLNPDRYLEFLNIMDSLNERGNMSDNIEKIINGLREVIGNLNAEVHALKAKLAAVEKKRKALLESMMFKRFNVIQGYDYARELRDMTEEIFSLKLTVSQMNKLQMKVNTIAPYINNANSKDVKTEAVRDVRSEILSDYYVFKDEKPALPVSKDIEKTVKSEPSAESNEQTG